MVEPEYRCYGIGGELCSGKGTDSGNARKLELGLGTEVDGESGKKLDIGEGEELGSGEEHDPDGRKQNDMKQDGRLQDSSQLDSSQQEQGELNSIIPCADVVGVMEYGEWQKHVEILSYVSQ